MSFINVEPDALVQAAADLADAGSAMAGRNASAATAITGVAPAGADRVSATTAAQFLLYGGLYRQLSAQAEAVLESFVTTLRTTSTDYLGAEVANTVGLTALAD